MVPEASVLLRDVTLRDGLQDEQPISTEDKIALYSAIVRAGAPELELTSFVRADRVPAMADAEELAVATRDDGAVVRWGLVLNLRGAQRALSAGLRHLQFVVSVSEAHSLNNSGRTVDTAFDELERVVTAAAAADAITEVTLATAFGCPHVGAIDSADVRRAVDRAVGAGVAMVGLADTIGTAVPTDVRDLVRAVQADHPELTLGVHLHDTRGLAIANCLEAIDAGVRRIDGSVGGLGGCPFAPGSSGNLALEDLVHALHHMGVATGVDLDRLLEAARLACKLVDRPVSTHVGLAGPRFAHMVAVDDRTPVR